MKHIQSSPQRIVSLCADAGVVVSLSCAAASLSYLEAIQAANESVNLTRISDFEQGIRLHVVDSLVALPEVVAAPDGPMLDLGSGGGFPGVPLALASSRPTTLLDSTAKKMRAVEEVLVAEGLATVIATAAARAEEYATQQPNHFAVVVARAVAPLPSLVELAAPFLSTDGVFVALKGSPEGTERTNARRVAALVGLRESSWRELLLPGGSETRTLVTYRRVAEPQVRIPRRTGLAQHSPLA